MSSTHSAHHVQAIKANQPKRTGPEAMVITGQAIDEESGRNEEIQMEEGKSIETQRLAAGADAKKKREETERKKKEEAEKQREKEEKERKKKVKKAAEKKQKADDKAERDAEKKRKDARRKADEARKKEAERLKKEGAVAEREARARRRAQRAAADEQPDENRENKKPPGMIVAAIQGVGKGLKAGVTKIGKAAKAVADKTCLAGQRTPSPARTPPSPVTFSFLDRAPVLSDTELLKSENNGHNGPHNHGYTRGTRHHPCDMLTFSSDYDLTARTCDDPCPSPQSVTSVVYAPQRIYVSEEQRRRNEEFEQALRPESDVLRKIAQWAKEEEEEEREEEERRREKTREKRRGEAERREMRRQHEAGTVKAVPVADPLGENSVVVRTSSTAVSSPPSSQEQHQQDQPVASPVTFDWIDENGAIPDKDQSGSPATFIRPQSDRTSIYTEYSRFSQWGSTISSQPNGSDRTALDRQSVVDSDANEAPDTSSPAPFAVPNGGAGSNLAILMTPGSRGGQRLAQGPARYDPPPLKKIKMAKIRDFRSKTA